MRNKGFKDRFGYIFVCNDTTVFMQGNIGRRIARQFAKLIKVAGIAAGIGMAEVYKNYVSAARVRASS
jgi:hypothetical protein